MARATTRPDRHAAYAAAQTEALQALDTLRQRLLDHAKNDGRSFPGFAHSTFVQDIARDIQTIIRNVDGD